MKTEEMNMNELISTILDEKNERDVVAALTLDFMKKENPDIFKLDEMVTNILHTTLTVAHEQLMDAKKAVAAAIALIGANPDDKEEINNTVRFVRLMNICKYFAPKGKLESWATPAQKRIFETFLKMFRDPEVFSFDREVDVNAVKRTGCWDYLLLVSEENKA